MWITRFVTYLSIAFHIYLLIIIHTTKKKKKEKKRTIKGYGSSATRLHHVFVEGNGHSEIKSRLTFYQVNSSMDH
jgi:hypothetical protein